MKDVFLYNSLQAFGRFCDKQKIITAFLTRLPDGLMPTRLAGTSCNNDLEVEAEYPPWNPTFTLEVLSLSNCKLNNHTGVIPSFLYGQHDLTQVDLSHNNLSGQFPTWLLENNPKLAYLNLRNNSFRGTFHLPLYSNNMTLLQLDISNNYISGQLSSNIGTLLPNLQSLNMSRNSFRGSIPPSVGNMTRLRTFDLSDNNFSGEIPEHVASGCVDMQFLRLSNNNLHGRIFSTSFNMTNLRYLFLDYNHFMGTLPPSVYNASLLKILGIEEDNISGRIESLPLHLSFSFSLSLPLLAPTSALSIFLSPPPPFLSLSFSLITVHPLPPSLPLLFCHSRPNK
ncbi:receptor-like protein 12 [Cinnamomum micranthum f. kanehirae]|uniref:Receptor-like protein 12 n=1 Tax=Cinnamomum micranthum f. kanehirae TaxID=337451 RepID=A0A3S3M9F1_9MAGN|nr:receptor-like protein 12 [Cinnamomum micranthum f. kanehirae]